MALHYASIVAYMCSSILIMWSNKQVLSIYNFPSTFALMIIQSIITTFVFLVLHMFHKVKIQVLSYERLKYHLPLLAVTIINIFFGLIGAASMPAAMFTALRRVSILLCMYAQMHFLKQKLSATAVCSVWCTVIAASFASFHDFNFNAVSYLYVMLNNVFTAAQQILTQVSMRKKISKPTLVVYNAITITTVSVFGIIIKGEMTELYDFNLWYHGQFIIVICLSCFMGLLINYSVFWCIEQNGALTLAVSGSIKNIVVGLLSCAGIFDNDYIFNWSNFIALQFAALASLVYVYSKSVEIKREELKTNVLNSYKS